jgi:tetratricopeptide (TPR) repeat protein
MFREALKLARTRDPRDAWAESRALVGIANVVSPVGDEQEALRIGLEALTVGDEAGQAFTAAGAHETVAGSLRRLLRLEDALQHAEAATGTLRELGARWELASALGQRGAIHRLAGRLVDAEQDLREAFVLCRDLKERALVTWTAAELARILAMQGDTGAARLILADPSARIAEGEPGSETALRSAEAVVALAEHDLQTARAKSVAALEAERGPRGLPNPLAAQVVWAAALFGDDVAGGPDEVTAARERLQRNGWRQALTEPDLVAGLLG